MFTDLVGCFYSAVIMYKNSPYLVKSEVWSTLCHVTVVHSPQQMVMGSYKSRRSICNMHYIPYLTIIVHHGQDSVYFGVCVCLPNLRWLMQENTLLLCSFPDSDGTPLLWCCLSPRFLYVYETFLFSLTGEVFFYLQYKPST